MEIMADGRKGGIHGGHRQRVKERYLAEGMDNFSDFQVLEFLLYYGIPYKDTNAQAHELLEKYGSLSGVFEADCDDLARTPGVGVHAAILLSMIPNLARRYQKDRWKDRTKISGTGNAGMYATSLFVGKVNEQFYMICLNTQSYVVKHVLISEGTINETTVYPRVIVENALRHKAASVIFAHNHPGGSTQPSQADIDITCKLKSALATVSVRVLDHIIVAGSDYMSFASNNYMT